MLTEPFAMVRNVLLLNMMKNLPIAVLGLSLMGFTADLRGAGAPGTPAPKMTPDQALQILMSNGFMARPYYSGVPDAVVIKTVDNRARMRAMINAKLSTMIVPKINPLHDFTMAEAIESLENTFKKADPAGVGFRMYINPFVDPGGVPINTTGGGANTGGPTGPAGPGGGQPMIDPNTGLPVGPGGPMGGGTGGMIDPNTGLPVGGGGAPGGFPGGGAGPGMAPGLPGAGGGLPGAGGGLPGAGGGLPGMGGGLPGMGGGAPGGGATPTGAFDPETVKLRGLTKEMNGMTAKQVLDIVCMSFDTPIQYVVTDQGLMFLQQRPELWGTVTRTFQMNLNSRTLNMMGVATPQLQAPQGGGGQPGGQPGGGGPAQPGGQPGGFPGQGAGGGGQGGYPGGGPGGGTPPGGATFKVTGQGGGFGSSYRPFSNLNRFTPAQPGFRRFNSFTPGYGPSRVRGRQ